jgi:hypothetical protein
MPSVECPHCGTANPTQAASRRCQECGKTLTVSASDLGKLRKTYRAGSLMLWLRLILGLAFCLAWLAGSVIVLIVAPRQDFTEWLQLGGYLAIFAGGYTVMMLLVFLPALESLGLNVAVHEKGVVVRQGSTVASFGWDDIEAIFHQIKQEGRIGQLHHFTVRLRDGRNFSWTPNLRDVAELGETVQREVADRLLPGARAACQAGEEVDFGRIKVSGQGILRDDGEILPWADVAKVEVTPTAVRVLYTDDWKIWCTVPRSRIPNPHVLLALLKDHRVTVS